MKERCRIGTLGYVYGRLFICSGYKNDEKVMLITTNLIDFENFVMRGDAVWKLSEIDSDQFISIYS